MCSLVLNISTASIINLFQCLNIFKVKKKKSVFICAHHFLSCPTENSLTPLCSFHPIMYLCTLRSPPGSFLPRLNSPSSFSLLIWKMFQSLNCICGLVLGSLHVLKLMWRREKKERLQCKACWHVDTCLDKHSYSGKKIIQAIWYKWATQKPTTGNQCVGTSYCLRRKEVTTLVTHSHGDLEWFHCCVCFNPGPPTKC